jgi:hypothetical protein
VANRKPFFRLLLVFIVFFFHNQGFFRCEFLKPGFPPYRK